MANKLDPVDLKQILTLQLEGYSNRKIGSVLGIFRNTVNTYMQLFAGSGYSSQELLSLDTPALSELFSSHTALDLVRHNELMLYFEGVNKAQNHPGFTFLFHYQQYVEIAAEPHSYTQFLKHYRRKYPKEKGSMKLQHIAGEEMFIDFAGKKLGIVDKRTGEIIPVEVFVAILPCCSYLLIKNILKNSMDRLPLSDDKVETIKPHIPFHSNIRGASAYE